MKFGDRYLRVLVPVVAREARVAPSPLWDEILAGMLEACARRGLRSIVADAARVSAGGAVEPPPAPNVRPLRES